MAGYYHGYSAYTKLSNMARPGPGKTWVFIEENPYSIDDAFFALDPRETTTWYNQSGSFAWQCQCAGVCRWTFGRPSVDRPEYDQRKASNTRRQCSDNWPADPKLGRFGVVDFSQHSSRINGICKIRFHQDGLHGHRIAGGSRHACLAHGRVAAGVGRDPAEFAGHRMPG